MVGMVPSCLQGKVKDEIKRIFSFVCKGLQGLVFGGGSFVLFFFGGCPRNVLGLNPCNHLLKICCKLHIRWRRKTHTGEFLFLRLYWGQVGIFFLRSDVNKIRNKGKKVFLLYLNLHYRGRLLPRRRGCAMDLRRCPECILFCTFPGCVSVHNWFCVHFFAA